MANPEGEAESEAVRLDFDRRLTPVSWFRGHVRPMCAIVIPFPRTPGNARLSWSDSFRTIPKQVPVGKVIRA